MSDIGIFNDPLSIAFLYLVFGSPGLLVGAAIGALLWREHRFWGALLGAVIGFGLCIGGWWLYLTY